MLNEKTTHSHPGVSTCTSESQLTTSESRISDEQLHILGFSLTSKDNYPTLQQIQELARELIYYRQLKQTPVAYTDAEEIAGSKCQAMAYLWNEPSGTGKDIALYTIP
ncbi:hypothetical protein [Trabulsiella odontotermitis]|uniref:hypothetical protein n=1 Tax=Trabulsiella odontotermitis TaxID=379893 RepID=UPI000F60A2A4|nr:hypothetical protein [Trabulsiella odontotermitis]